MVKRSFLEEYRIKECSVGEVIAPNLLDHQHVIKDPLSLYPEYSGVESFALHRPGVNIGALLFLHPSVIAYVPPIMPDEFPSRFGVSYQTFLELAYPTDEKCKFVYPVLNHPRYYSSPEIRAGLSDILIRTPPTWERWHSVLEVSGGEKWLEFADERIPYEKLWCIHEIRAAWEARLLGKSKSSISKEIKQQIKNNYTDLCLVGLESEANDISRLANSDPYVALSRLYFSSEFFAYPFVMGAGGNPHMLAMNDKLVQQHLKTSCDAGFSGLPSLMDTEVVETLLEGLQFHNLPRIYRAEFLVNFHKSEQAGKVRNAYQKLLSHSEGAKPSIEDIHDAIKQIISELKTFCDSSEAVVENISATLSERQNSVAMLCAVGGVLTSVGGFWIHPAVGLAAGVFFSVFGLAPIHKRKKIEKEILERYFNSIPYELYSDFRLLKDYRKKNIGSLLQDSQVEEAKGNSVYSSTKARTIWWNH